MTVTEPVQAAPVADDRPGKSIASLLGKAPVSSGPAVRLADSPLWQRQRTFYAGDVPRIWGTATAPHAITANARIAHTYARIAAEFLRSSADAATLDVAHIVEVGGGSGRFAYLFIRALRELAPEREFRYVLTDFSSDRIDAWREHPAFQQFLGDGVIDFAVLDADDAGPLELAVAGRRLSGRPLDAPVLGIANYVFDTLRHDGFAIRGGELSELRLALDTPADPDDGAEAATGHWESVPCESLPDELASILEDYRATLDDTTILVPIGGMRILDRFRSLTTGPVCTLVADKGHTRPRELCGQESPAIVWHGGAFSVMVNFDLLARWIRQRGGTSTLPADPARSLVVATFVEGDPAGRLATLPAFVQDQLLDIGPDNFFALRPMLTPATGTTIDALLAVLRLSRFDAGTFAELLPALLEVLPDCPESRRSEVERVLRHVEGNWFDIGEPIDMALCLGLAFGAMSRFDEAVRHLQLSVTARPNSADSAVAMAFAQRGRRDLPAAMHWVQRALELQPAMADARSLRVTLADELGLQP
jgi:hypothetical protein